MLTWVMYDIPKDRTRNKIAKLCEESGIYRVQYSIFLGELNNAQRKELTINLKDLMNNDEDSVYVFPMCNEDFNKCKLLGQAFNKELIADEIKTLFL
ncbi:MAG: CRISPR-associated endonuclease Cas2 [Candidatus Tenebribacter mawsonii]|nr:CRISPR-associated endonuclease Cas2 [Candidatus Tenebribacter mawsonii]